MNILFAGVGYFPFLTAGEKNFFFRLLPLLKKHVDVAVFSLNDWAESTLRQGTVLGDIPVYCARRPFHRNYERFYFRGKGYTAYRHLHKPSQETSEKFIAVLTHLPRLRRIIHRHDIKVIHFMDNFGPAMPFLGRVFPRVKITYAAANYDPRGRPALYDAYLKLSIGFLSGAGVYTQAYLKKLQEIGIRTPLKLTRWGVPIRARGMDIEKKVAVRKELGVKDGQRLLLWSGYIQQIQEQDFYKTVEVARQVVQVEQGATFVFAFKPEVFRPEYLQKADDRIKVVTGLKNFGDVLEAADLFCSPVSDSRSTVSPPLTWLEAMSRKTPVITTEVGGVDEVITHRETGYVAPSYNELANVIIEAIRDDALGDVSQCAKESVHKEFNIQQSTEAYIKLWEKVLGYG